MAISGGTTERNDGSFMESKFCRNAANSQKMIMKIPIISNNLFLFVFKIAGNIELAVESEKIFFDSHRFIF
jgi:hypothetical protein